MLTVHHLSHSQSERVIWLCEEIGLPYKLIRYEREASGRAPEAYRALHPLQTAPIITDGELTLAESGAIVEYILRRYANGQLLLGPEHPEFTDFLFWFHFANGSFVPALMVEHLQPKDAPLNPSSRSERAYRLIETRLGEATWFAGNTFTAADVMMALPRFAARRDLSNSPNIRAYLARLSEREAWRVAAAKAEPAGL
jgi:glutathione S-transferase